MSSNIRHDGIVDSIEGDHVQIRIVQTSACAACKVAGYCNAAESKEKLVDVYHADTKALHVGDAVVVTASPRLAAHALLLAFGGPFMVMIAVLVAILWLTGNEAHAALGGLLALIPYYGGLFLFREKLRDRMTFDME